MIQKTLIGALIGLLLGIGYDFKQFGSARKKNQNASFNWTLAFYRWIGGALSAAAGVLGAENV